MNKTVIVFAPHPDDETLGCGGTIAKKISEGYEVVIAIMTGGENALSKTFGLKSDPTPEELKKIRKKEIINATRILGVNRENLYFFDFEDGALQECGVELEMKITELLRNFSPVEVYYPYEKDFNLDHQAANRAIVISLRDVGFSSLQYQYSIAQKFSRVGPFVAKVLNFFKRHLVFVDVSQYLHLKENAIKQYVSQITVISAGQIKPVLEDVEKFLKAKEVFYLGNVYR